MTETSLAADIIEQVDEPEQHESRDTGDPADQVDQVVQYYGLTHDPFAGLGDVFLLTPKIEKLLRLLNYLTRFSHKLIVVTADAGVGKTCVAEQFLQQVNGDRDYCQINGLADDTPAQMLREIADQVGLKELQSASLAELNAGIHSYADDLVEDGRTCLILIDDADLLGASVLDALFDLVQPSGGDISPLHLVLFGRPQLEANLSGIESLADNRHHVFHYQLSRFSFKECCQYLQICFSRAGDQARIPFSKADYLRIHQNSRGVPLDIVAEARLTLADGVNRLVTNTPPPKWVLSAAVAFSLVAAVLVGALLWQQRGEQQVVAGDTAVSDSKVLGTIERAGAPLLTETGEVDKPGQGQAAEDLVASQPLNEEALEAVAGAAMAPEDILAEVADRTIEAAEEIVDAELAAVTTDAQTAPQEDLDQTLPLLAGPELVDVLSEGTASGELPVPLETAQRIVVDEALPSTPAEQTAAPEPYANPGQDESYATYSASERAILESSGGNYTLQLLGARTEQQILEFLAPYQGVDEYRYFRTELKGAPWYVVIYGSYSDRATAKAAGASLPNSLGVREPWIRKLAGIQSALRDRAESPQVTQQ